MRKKIRFLIIITLCLVVILGIASFAFAWHVLDTIVRPQTDYTRDYDVSYTKVFHRYPQLQYWQEDLIEKGLWRDTMITADDGVKLHGVFIQHDSAAMTAMVIHGYRDNAVIMMRYAYLCYLLKLNVFMPEMRYHGKSGDDHTLLGWNDRYDMLRWIKIVHERWPDQEIFMYGLSMGAACTLSTAGEGTPDYVRGFISDCAPTNVWDGFQTIAYNEFGLPKFPFYYMASWLCDLRYGFSFKDASAYSMVSHIEKPVLFVHGDQDKIVPVQMGFELYNHKENGKRELWVATGCDHARAIHNHYDLYLDHIGEFVNTLLGRAYNTERPDAVAFKKANGAAE